MENSTVPTIKFDFFINALNKKGVRHEIMEKNKREGMPLSEKMIGIPTNRHNYHWFKWIILAGEEFIWFDHTYSQNNGKTKRGYSHKVRVAKSLAKKLGIDEMLIV